MKTRTKLKLRGGLVAALALGAGASSNLTTQAADLVAFWDFEKVESDNSIKSLIGGYTGVIMDAAIQTGAGEGRPGAGGGKGFDVSPANKGYLLLEAVDADNPMNIAAAEDQVTVVVWQKNNNNINSSTFWGVAATQARGLQFHIPWSDGTIYFDTSGCCGGNTRISQNVGAAIDGFNFNEWHHYAFVKDGLRKAMYIDGNLLKEQEGFDPLPIDFTALYIGAANDRNSPDGVIDDFAIYKGVLTEDEIKKLAAGASPIAELKDTDKDGMGDDWETTYGFNPNDASDGPQDADGDGVSNLDEFKNGGHPKNTTPPKLTTAVTTATLDTIVLTFEDLESLEGASATNKANYAISPALTIDTIALKGKTVTLKTAKQTAGGTKYTVTVTGVRNLSKKTIAANNSASFYSYLLGKSGLKLSYWGGITGTPVQGLYDDPRYPATPDEVHGLLSFNSRDAFPNDSRENYGATIEGILTPLEAGDYHFFLRSDDASELYISSDDKEANLTKVAEELGCCNAFLEPSDTNPRTTATPISLVAGKKYFIRAVYKEGGGGDYCQVAWRKVGDTTPAGSLQPIAGHYLTATIDIAAPSEGVFTTQVPASNAKNVAANTPIRIVHRNGKTALTAANTKLKVDGVQVTPTVTKEGNILTVDYPAPGIYASGSVHTVSFEYLDAGGDPVVRNWSFTVQTWSGPTKDKVGSYPGLIMGNAKFTADKGGKSGAAGDYGLDQTVRGGPVVVFDNAFTAAASAAVAKDELSVAFWMRKYDIAASSAFWFIGSASSRPFQSHLPWSDNNVYYDTGSNCCAADTQRISAGADTFPDYTGDIGFWTNGWRHFAFTKKGASKQVWIDGKLFLEGAGAEPIPGTITQLMIGSDNAGGGLNHGIIDDFAVFNTQLTEANVKALAGTTLPSALPAATGLIAYWDFNDAAGSGGGSAKNLKVTRTAGGKVKVAFEGTGVVQSADRLGGTFTDTAIKNGDEIEATGAARFLRIKP